MGRTTGFVGTLTLLSTASFCLDFCAASPSNFCPGCRNLQFLERQPAPHRHFFFVVAALREGEVGAVANFVFPPLLAE